MAFSTFLTTKLKRSRVYKESTETLNLNLGLGDFVHEQKLKEVWYSGNSMSSLNFECYFSLNLALVHRLYQILHLKWRWGRRSAEQIGQGDPWLLQVLSSTALAPGYSWTGHLGRCPAPDASAHAGKQCQGPRRWGKSGLNSCLPTVGPGPVQAGAPWLSGKEEWMDMLSYLSLSLHSSFSLPVSAFPRNKQTNKEFIF